MRRTPIVITLLSFILLSSAAMAQPPAPPLPGGAGVLSYISDLDGDYEVYTLDIGADKTRQLTNNDTSDWYSDWSPDGDQLVFSSGRDGADYEIYLMDADCDSLPGGCEANLKQLTDNDASDLDPVWSPDGKQIAFVSDLDGDEDLYLINPEGGTTTPITNNTTRDKDPAWSPDGQGIFYSGLVGADLEIALTNFTGEPRLFTDNDAPDEAPAISPNGRYLAFHSNVAGNYDIYILDIYTQAIEPLTDDPADDFTPDWSPDGKQLAFVSNRDGDYDIYTVNADGSGLQPITDNDANDLGPAWQPVGSSSTTSDIPVVPTLVPATAVIVTATPDLNSGPCRLVSTETGEVNVRSGPGTNYDILGKLLPGNELSVAGYNGEWFAVGYGDRYGWLAGWLIQLKGNCAQLTLVVAPPAPTAPPATLVPTAPAGAVIEFWADKTSLSAGQCTRIYWRTENIRAVDFNGAGVIGQDSREVCPTVYTTYTLRVTLQDGSIAERTVNIAVISAIAAQPDVYVSEFSLSPNPPVQGQPVNVRIGIYNQGNAAVPATAFRIEWWAGQNFPSPACTWDLGSMSAHGGRILECTYPGYNSWYGSLNTVVKVDVNNTISESNESNNTFTQTISVSKP